MKSAKFGKNSFSTSVSVNSSQTTSQTNTSDSDSDIKLNEEQATSLLNFQEINAAIIEKNLIKDNDISSIADSFPWFYDSNGDKIDYNADIRLFKGIELISNFLEKKHRFDTSTVSEVILSDILKPFENKKNVTVLELYNHVSSLYTNGKIKDTVISEIENESKEIMEGEKFSEIESKPLGEFGEVTINQLINKTKEHNWVALYKNVEITENAVPMALNLISYGFVLNAYAKHVHRTPAPSHYNALQLQAFQRAKVSRLIFFSAVWAPLIVMGIRTFSPGIFKNALDIKLLPSSSMSDNILPSSSTSDNILPSSSTSDNSSINKSGLMLVLSKIRDTCIKYIPENLRAIIKGLFFLFSLIFIMFNFLGFEGAFNILNNKYYIKLFCYISCSLIIFYEILNLYLLHKFINKNINISTVLPKSIIVFLKDIECFSSDIESIKFFKKTCYIHILLYMFSIIMVSLIF